MEWLYKIINNFIWQTSGYFSFIDRVGVDFDTPYFTADGNWHTIDFSGLVPEQTKCVQCTIQLKESVGFKQMRFRKWGATTVFPVTGSRTQAANQQYRDNVIVPVSKTGLAEYNIQPAVWSEITIQLVGYWRFYIYPP